MRRWLTGVGLAVLSLSLAAACGRPAGLDGRLADDWAALPEARARVPVAGDCLDGGFSQVPLMTAYQPVPCAGRHQLEVLHVGTVAGDDPRPPAAGSTAWQDANSSCAAEARTFLGDFWQLGRVFLGVAVPSNAAWTAGARWFRCDVWEYPELSLSQTAVERTGTLRGALVRGGPLRHGCYRVTETATRHVDLRVAACTAAHNGEFVGLYIAPPSVPAPNRDTVWDVAAHNCWGLVARYAGLVEDATLSRRTKVVYHWYGAPEWQRGNRTIICIIHLPRTVTKLMQGAGPAAFPQQ